MSNSNSVKITNFGVYGKITANVIIPRKYNRMLSQKEVDLLNWARDETFHVQMYLIAKENYHFIEPYALQTLCDKTIGITCGWLSFTEMPEEFKWYTTVEEFVSGYIQMLKQPRYQGTVNYLDLLASAYIFLN